MAFELETAAEPQKLRRIAIDPISRVEGHGKITLLMDDAGHVQQARLHIVEFRGFERFIQGRPYWEAPVMVQRLCGICPVSHQLAAAKALDHVVGATPPPPSADKMRRLMHYGQIVQSHALHFFMLGSPDLLFGFDAEVGRRNIVAVAENTPRWRAKASCCANGGRRSSVTRPASVCTERARCRAASTSCSRKRSATRSSLKPTRWSPGRRLRSISRSSSPRPMSANMRSSASSARA